MQAHAGLQHRFMRHRVNLVLPRANSSIVATCCQWRRLPLPKSDNCLLGVVCSLLCSRWCAHLLCAVSYAQSHSVSLSRRLLDKRSTRLPRATCCDDCLSAGCMDQSIIGECTPHCRALEQHDDAHEAHCTIIPIWRQEQYMNTCNFFGVAWFQPETIRLGVIVPTAWAAFGPRR